MSDSRDWQAGGTPPDPAPRPTRPLPPHLDPRGRGGPPRPPAQHVIPGGKIRKPRRAARILSWIAIVTSVAVLATAGAGYLLISHYEGNIRRITGVFDRKNAPPPAPHNAQNVLLVGSDSRGSLKAGQGVQGSGATYVTGERSDTVILAHLYGGGSNKAQLVSFPRDSVVLIPEFTDPKTGRVHRAHHAKLNAAIFEGGPPLLVRTIQDLTHVRVDHYLQVDFDGFKSMVNKLGGVDVCLPRAAKEHDSGINLSAGHHHINGDVALAFVRQRKGLPNGDIDRIKRQQEFIGAIIRKVLSAGTLANPFKLNGFLNVATSSLQADQGLDFSALRSLALRLRNFGAGNVLFSTIPITNLNGYDPVLGSVVLIDMPKADELFTQLRMDIPPGQPAPKPTSAAGTAPLTVRPGAIRVHVYNGSGVNGLGRKADGDLAGVGFQTVGTPQTRGTGAAATLVRYGPTKSDSARTVAAAIPGATLEADPGLANVIEVVVGTSYAGAHAVTVTSVSPTQPSVSASPKVVTAQDDPCAA
ncbi:MAG: LCP family protein [Mycobacteriales bacterium]